MKPIAFRIIDFRSITDSGVCTLSGDNITVLAGQNEAGKSAVLTALRDFDLPIGTEAQTPDFMPEGKIEASPSVSVLFEVDVQAIENKLLEQSSSVPSEVIQRLVTDRKVWVTRDLLRRTYTLDQRLTSAWPAEVIEEIKKASDISSVLEQLGAEPEDDEVSVDDDVEDESEATLASAQDEVGPCKLLGPEQFAALLRGIWPSFVYFDTFQDSLPRDTYVDRLGESNQAVVKPTTKQTNPVPQSVRDFLDLSNISLQRIQQLEHQDKALGNYLQSCSAHITGDFLTYWKQKFDGGDGVDLKVKHERDSEGNLKLAFYVHDQYDQYPEQRSRGFLWFLSFYLRLAAANRESPGHPRLLLIDEPGTYLHARAQLDVLHLFEERISKSEYIIYTTHSPYLLPSSKLHRVRMVVKGKEKGSLVLDRLTHPALMGDELTDALSPIISNIGLDIRQSLTFARDYSLIVEGITDHIYISALARQFQPALLDDIGIFPSTGAGAVPVFASLFIGWGLRFAVLLDRDSKGEEVKNKLVYEMGLDARSVIQPNGMEAIEDVFSAEDFRNLVRELDPAYLINPGESNTAAIKRLRIDKVLLARKYAELAATNAVALTERTTQKARRLLSDIETAVHRV